MTDDQRKDELRLKLSTLRRNFVRDMLFVAVGLAAVATLYFSCG